MRIALISEHASLLATPGDPVTSGQSIHVAGLAAALARYGHEVRVYCRRDRTRLPAVTATDGYAVVPVPVGPPEPLPGDALLPHMKPLGGWLADQWHGSAWQPDVIHAHFWTSGIAAVLAGQQIGSPVVQSFHSLGIVERRHQGIADSSPPDRIRYERTLGRAADRVVAQCRDEMNELRQIGVPPGKMTMIPSGVDGDRFAPARPLTIRGGPPWRVLTVGEMVERKGFADVVRALRAVPEAECVLIGGPPADRLDGSPFASRLRALAESCQVADRLRLVGAVPPAEMPGWYRSADVVVAAPWYEPFGRVPIEAMSCGVPVIGTAVGGLTDTIVDGVTGQLVPPRNHRALGLALRRLLRDEQRRYAYAVAALDRAQQCYSWERVAAQLSEVYRSVARRQANAVA